VRLLQRASQRGQPAHRSGERRRAALIYPSESHTCVDTAGALACWSLPLAAGIRCPYSHRMPLCRAKPSLHLPSALERLGPMAHSEVVLRWEGGCIQGRLQMLPDPQAPQAIGAGTPLPCQRLECLWARHPLRGLRQLVQLVEDCWSLPGVVGIVAGQTRLTCHLHAPFRSPYTLKQHR
jgi:hypothetical protein